MEYPKVKPCLNTSENDLVQELYQPCLQWASRFDRGVGYFTTGWLTHNIVGLSDFASRGGIMRLITSPILSNTPLISTFSSGISKPVNFKEELPAFTDKIFILTHLSCNLL